MQTLDVRNPGMPDLQFVLMVLALCTSDLKTLNVPVSVRTEIFDRCWALLHEGPPPADPKERRLDLRQGTELTLEAMVETIQTMLSQAGVTTLTWEHPPSEATRETTPEALPLIERLQKLYPPSSDGKTES
jgi:hypothetical protein